MTLCQVERNCLKSFALVDIMNRRLYRETELFQDQRGALRAKRKEIEKEISTLLDQRFRLEEFEKAIDRLNSIYGELAQYTEGLSSRVSNLRDDIHQLEEELRYFIRDGDQIFSPQVEEYEHLLQVLRHDRQNFLLAQEKVKNAIDVLRMKISVERGRETVELQHESISLQVAASFIEFIVLFYYTLNSWKILANKAFASLSSPIILVSVTGFCSGIVLFTHSVALARRAGRRFTPRMALSILISLAFLIAMFLLTLEAPH